MYRFNLANQDEADEIFKLYHSLIGTPGCTWNLDYPNKEIVQTDIDKKSLYTLRDSENMLASVAFAGKSDELDSLCWSLNNPCDLARIGVASMFQRQGIGTIILKKVITVAKARGFDGIRMLVSKSNPSALALYDKNGFIKCGEAFMFEIDFHCYEMIF